ncbi:MAG: S1 RNA-binding domain-containing protein [Deltaproteobacteria bacterium]|nr:S1 RNA-binding domain-containing protein [Deltaproteobacteria bacterium]
MAEDRNPDTNEEDFSAMLDATFTEGFKVYERGEKIDGSVVAISSSNIIVDIGQRTEGIVDRAEFSDEEMDDIAVGSVLNLWVVRFTPKGTILSRALLAKSLDLAGLQEAAASRIPIEGRVSSENKGGFTVDLPGGSGFVPHSQMEYGRNKQSSEYIGQTFRFLVLEIRGKDVVLSRAAIQKEQVEEERAQRLEELKEGMILSVEVVKLESFGAFVDLGSGLNALVPRSETAWSRPDEAMAALKPGQTITVKVLRIEREEERPKIACSLRQAGDDPWDTSAGNLVEGQVVRGTVTRVKPFGAFVEIVPGIEGLLHISEMSAKQRVKNPNDIVQPGMEVSVAVTSVDATSRRIGLSLKAIQAAEDDVTDDLKERFMSPGTAPRDESQGNTAMAEALRRAMERKDKLA